MVVYVSNRDETTYRIKLDMIWHQFVWGTLMSMLNKNQNREIQQCMYDQIATYLQCVPKQLKASNIGIGDSTEFP